METTPAAGRVAHRRRRGDAAKHRRIAISVDDTEYEELAAAAAGAEVSVSTFVADAALSTARATRTPDLAVVREVLRELVGASVQVQKIGVNLNQAVAKLHATGQPAPELVSHAAVAARAIERLDGLTITLR